jgi:hypothetical protein
MQKFRYIILGVFVLFCDAPNYRNHNSLSSQQHALQENSSKSWIKNNLLTLALFTITSILIFAPQEESFISADAAVPTPEPVRICSKQEIPITNMTGSDFRINSIFNHFQTTPPLSWPLSVQTATFSVYYENPSYVGLPRNPGTQRAIIVRQLYTNYSVRCLDASVYPAVLSSPMTIDALMIGDLKGPFGVLVSANPNNATFAAAAGFKKGVRVVQPSHSSVCDGVDTPLLSDPIKIDPDTYKFTFGPHEFFIKVNPVKKSYNPNLYNRNGDSSLIYSIPLISVYGSAFDGSVGLLADHNVLRDETNFKTVSFDFFVSPSYVRKIIIGVAPSWNVNGSTPACTQLAMSIYSFVDQAGDDNMLHFILRTIKGS